MTDQLQKYYSFKQVIERLLFYSGLWPSGSSSTFYKLVPFIHLTANVLMTCAMLNFCCHNIANLDLFLKGLGTAFGFWGALQKMICVIMYRKRLFKLHTSLDRCFNEELEDSRLRPILLSSLGMFRSSAFAIIIMTYMVHFLSWMTPLIAIGVQYFKRVDRINYIFPYPAVYPWRNNGWRYPAHYVFQLYAGFSLGALSSSIDALFAFYIFQICGQLRTLSHRVANIKPGENYHKVIRECVDKHNFLARCQDNLERIYGPIVIYILVISAIIMCSFIYQASHMSLGKAAVVVVYIAMKSLQTLFYGACGSILTTDTHNFRQAIYASDWAASGDKCFITDILVMITYNPLPLTACSLSTISVDMFLAVCNTAISYFFMIRTLEEGNSV